MKHCQFNHQMIRARATFYGGMGERDTFSCEMDTYVRVVFPFASFLISKLCLFVRLARSITISIIESKTSHRIWIMIWFRVLVLCVVGGSGQKRSRKTKLRFVVLGRSTARIAPTFRS